MANETAGECLYRGPNFLFKEFMREFIWKIIARIVTRPAVTQWLISRAQRTPYTHITSADGTSVYMGRWWLFNPYPGPSSYTRNGWRDWLPSVRVHHIKRADQDRHLHDHPWNARTIVLRGWYEEESKAHNPEWFCFVNGEKRGIATRFKGYTGRLLFGQYHRISAVPTDGVWTLFFTWRKRGTWGFDVDGNKVPWRDYLAAGGEQ